MLERDRFTQVFSMAQDQISNKHIDFLAFELAIFSDKISSFLFMLLSLLLKPRVLSPFYRA